MGQALVLVDIQNDFCSGGALPVPDGERVVEPANALIDCFEGRGLPIAFTRDWHPPRHISFKGFGGSWPVHCVAGTVGAAFHPGLHVPPGAMIISKAQAADQEAYSGSAGTGLGQWLKERDVSQLVVGGLATDYCVKNTVLDALKGGFSVMVVEEAIRAVNVKAGDAREAVAAMRSRGARFVSLPRALDAVSSAPARR